MNKTEEENSNMKRRLLAGLLTCVMLFSLLPATALADEEGEKTSEEIVGTTEESAEKSTAEPAEGSTEEPAAGTTEEPSEEPAEGSTEGTVQGPAEGSGPAAGEGAGEELPAGEEAVLLADSSVARVEGVEYGTLDEAIAAAGGGGTVELLADATTSGLDLSKNLTIWAAKGMEKTPTLTFHQNGIALRGAELTFRNIQVDMDGIGSTPYTAEWNWMTICASKNAALTLDNVTMTMDGANAGNAHAIYFCSNNKLNLQNGSKLTIENYKQDALEWDGGDGGYNVNITDSTFISDNNRSGFTGTFYATITDSEVDVVNSTGNGSNGSHFVIKDSTVKFNDNADHGLSASSLSIDHSTVSAAGNGANGIHVTGALSIDGHSNVEIARNGCSISSEWTIPGALYIAGESTIANSSVTITGNKGSGIYQKDGTLTVLDSASVTVTNNEAVKLGLGGGIYVNGTVNLSDSTVLYNNHAGIAGDDIYNNDCGTISFGKVGSEWYLDGAPDCTHRIDGWYDDPKESRWEAHDEDSLYIDEFTGFNKNGMATVKTGKALKAAHAYMKPDPIVPEWDVSKSKTATNLTKDSTGVYTSDVTLSLPSAEEQLVSDVVLVLDKSTSADVEDQALAMLSRLKDRLDDTQAKIQVGVVIFNKVANVANGGSFFDLSEEYENIEEAIRQTISSGTNTHAGLLAGKAMLDNDTRVDASRKYLIFVSDAVTYMYGAEPTATAWTFYADAWKVWAGPDNWNSKYGTNDAPADWDVWLAGIGRKVTEQGSTYEYPYGGKADAATPQENWETAYANTVDKALYLTNQVYQEAVAEGYHCYAMTATQNTGSQYSWGLAFMEYLAGGKEVSFGDIQNDIYYLLGSGSSVVDVIGKGTYGTTDRFAYDFDFANSDRALTLTVNGKKLNVTKLTEPDLSMSDPWETARYGFGEADSNIQGTYPYVLHYYEKGRDGRSDECFVWDINVPVSNFERVRLTYTVKLTNPQMEVGVYGKYDEDGLDDVTGRQLEGNKFLFTNKSATLYPVDSDNHEVQPEDFSRPTVSYEVTNEPEGTLYVTKYVLDSKADPEQKFTFQATIGGAAQEFELRAGETKAISGLTVGAAYTVLETDPHGYTANYFHNTGTITGSSSGDTAVVVNVPRDEGALVISKTVNGGGSTTKEFTFTVNLTGADGAYTYTGSKTGTIKSGESVTLKNGESVAINNLPVEARYQITEKAETNYKTAISGNDALMAGTISGSTVSGTIVGGSAAVAHYTNTYSSPYTPGGGSGGKPGTGLNTDDHYSYIIGYKDGTLQPYGTITRGEVAAIFFRLLTDEAREKYWSQTNSYSDCGSDLWCNNAISTLTNMGIIDGYRDGAFRPYGKITRAQFAKIAVGFFETTRKEYKGYFTDVPEDAWYTDYVEAASRVGLIEGFEDGTFRPDTNITRAQACVIVNRALGRKPDEDHLLREREMVTWPDCNPGDWYYADMQEATNSHDYKWLTVKGEAKAMEEWTEKLPQRDWAALEHAWSTAHSAPGGEVVK